MAFWPAKNTFTRSIQVNYQYLMLTSFHFFPYLLMYLSNTESWVHNDDSTPSVRCIQNPRVWLPIIHPCFDTPLVYNHPWMSTLKLRSSLCCTGRRCLLYRSTLGLWNLELSHHTCEEINPVRGPYNSICSTMLVLIKRLKRFYRSEAHLHHFLEYGKQ
jgi:hypothetical protein